MDTNRLPLEPARTSPGSIAKLLDLLTAMKWDLKKGLRDGAAAPDELASKIGRMFDDIDASISRLREIAQERGLPLSLCTHRPENAQ